MQFKYAEQLDKESFRIFTLKPGSKSDDLLGSLQTYPLGAAPEYEALSYVWGSPDRRKSMVCNGEVFKITESLDVALRRLRLTSKPRNLWIDQICINQDCMTERSEQVGIMRQIYSDAAMTVIWLGSADPEEAAAAASIVYTLANNKNHYVKGNSFPQNDQLKELGLPARESPAWRALNSMLSAEYFSRVWIIQEVLTSANFILLWGDSLMPKKDFEDFVWKAALYSMSAIDSDTNCPYLNTSNVTSIFMRDSLLEKNTLFDLVVEAASCHATDPRDKIFALVGLAGHQTYNIIPNYTRSESDVFEDFTRKVILAENNLDILGYSYVKDPECPDRLPLWAPRWHFNDESYHRWLINYEFNASKDTRVQLKPSKNGKSLRLEGLQIDVVKDVHHMTIEVHEGILAAIDIAKDHIDSFIRRNGPDLIRPVLLTMMAGRESGTSIQEPRKRPDDDTYLDNFVSFTIRALAESFGSEEYSGDAQRKLMELMKIAVNASHSATRGTPTCQAPEMVYSFNRLFKHHYPDNPEVVSSFMEDLSRISCDLYEGYVKFLQDVAISYTRAFFITQKGYIGVGPPCMKPGDRVCILFGGSIPNIVRPKLDTGDEHLFLGSAYVHGIMDGEVIDAWERDKGSEEQEFQEKLFTLL
ncbi:heterokaryon incompatibility 6 OR allele [Fusarium beomiforme]|uniref:Heterokaryon incompatibility 6 OR allele n=1 Tax=Fusarium beomiforme TaxID=44412 RepID=A0A9P5AAU0_9HYPO|nr:heterokaryon incompatibility 6 OR allele [Fusarium beomiforme]